MSTDNIIKFVEYLDYTYSMINIYRAIIIINNLNENELLLLEEQLKNKDHNPLFVNNNNGEKIFFQ